MTLDLLERITMFLLRTDSASAEEIADVAGADLETVGRTLATFGDVYESTAGRDKDWRIREPIRKRLGEVPKGNIITLWALIEINKIACREVSRISTCRACGEVFLRSFDEPSLCEACALVRHTHFAPADVKLPTLKDFGVVDAD
jgi:hypothetical protein